MKLPMLKYTQTAYRREVVPFLGLNQTDNWKDGELSACKNLSARRYPYLAPRKSRSGQKYSVPSAIFAWDGKLVVVDGTTLLYDGQTVGTVAAGEKQFAVVNTKLCIWPDAVYLDLVNLEFKPLGPSIQALQNSVSFTANTITLAENPRVSAITEQPNGGYYVIAPGGCQCASTVTMAYTDMDWDENAGAWVLTGGKQRKIGGEPFQFNGQPETTGTLTVGDLVPLEMTEIDGAYKLNLRGYTYNERTDLMTDTGYKENLPYYYAKITYYRESVSDGSGGVFAVTLTIGADIYDSRAENPLFSTFFSVGDRVKVSGCTSIGNNTAENSYLVVSGTNGRTISFSTNPFTAGSEAGEVVISRPLPPMDYICESENRIWGISNADKTIYASALGDPRNFYVYDGVSTDSYAVAVGSEGDFTAICRYGNAVLCWKERTLHKILGSFPAEYQMASYQYAGIRTGCHKSLVNLNEVLYYLGVDGVYAYAGGTPTRISDELGEAARYQGVAGTDGRRYVLSCTDGTGVWGLLVYDTSTRLWLREDETHAADFCRMGDSLLFLSGSSVYTMEAGTDAVEWSATLCPFFETVQGRKRFSRLFLRVEVPKGAWMMAEVRCDGGRWREAGKIVGGETDVRTLPIAPNRCDKFEVRLSGKGDCSVLSLLREFRVESER